jgi:hypothetical protein
MPLTTMVVQQSAAREPAAVELKHVGVECELLLASELFQIDTARLSRPS